jgi:hypothetical protein
MNRVIVILPGFGLLGREVARLESFSNTIFGWHSQSRFSTE